MICELAQMLCQSSSKGAISRKMQDLYHLYSVGIHQNEGASGCLVFVKELTSWKNTLMISVGLDVYLVSSFLTMA